MKKVIIILGFVLILPSILAQRVDLHFEFLNSSKGLSNNSVNCVAQDNTGCIWIGTRNGLNKYDSQEIRIYKYKKGDSTSIPHRFVNSILVSKNDKLYVATDNGICCYNEMKDQFDTVHLPEGGNSSSLNKITAIVEDESGNVYFTSEDHLYLLNEETKRSSIFFKLQQGMITKVVFDKKGEIWISAQFNGGLYHLSVTGQVIRHYKTSSDFDGLNLQSIYDMECYDNKIMIASYGRGLKMYDFKTEQFSLFDIKGFGESNIRHLYVDKDNRLWIMGYTGLYLYNNKDNSVFYYYYNRNTPFAIMPKMRGIFQDKQHNYWSYHAHSGIGLSASLQKGFQIFNFNSSYWPTSSNEILQVSIDNKGLYWIANSGGGIDVYDWDNGSPVFLSTKNKNPNNSNSGNTFDILNDGTYMWVGTNTGGLLQFDQQRNLVGNYMHDPNDPHSISNNDIRSLDIDKEGNIWMVVHGKGVDKFDVKNQVFENYNSANNNLSNNWTFNVLVDHEDNIWVGTTYGINKLERGKKDFQLYSADVYKATLSNNEIACFYQDSDRIIWAGTHEGLNFYNAEKDQFEPVKCMLGEKPISSILDIKNTGELWVGTLDGLYRYDKIEDEIILKFDTNDGIPSNEFCPSSACKNDGQMFFGTNNGFVVFAPQKLKYDTSITKVSFKDLYVNNKKIGFDDSSEILERPINLSDRISFNHHHKIITFSFVGINMIYPDKIEYAYWMEGLNDDWQKLGAKNEITFTYLRAGEYTLKLKASNSDGVWSDEVTYLRIIMNPPWWQTLLFKSVVLFCLLACFIVFYMLRTSSLRRQQVRLKKQVKERTKELIEINELLGEKSKDLNDKNIQLEEMNGMKDRMLSIIAHDLRSPFNTIMGFSELLYRRNKDKDERLSRMTYAIYDSTAKLYQLLENLLRWAKSQMQEIKINPEILIIKDLMDVSIQVLKFQMQKKEIKLLMMGDDTLEIFTDGDALSTVIRNLVSNSIKYSSTKGEIIVKCEKVSNGVGFTISDKGTGISDNQLEKILNKVNVKSIYGTNGEKGTGIGLLLTLDLLEKIAVDINIDSQEGKGTTISFVIPSKQ
ncbi:ATP-binding protein [Bacteroidales bacterium]|nr:ATP-binding protein [Bacteroidales bacterium]